MQAKGTAFVPAISIADSLGIYEVQVRKDLAAVSSSPGKPRVGFSVDGLIADIEHFLGYDNANLAALVGAGNLGKALLSYGGFAEYGLDIAAAFDTDPALAGQCIHGCTVYPMERLAAVCREKNIHISKKNWYPSSTRWIIITGYLLAMQKRPVSRSLQS